MSGPYRTPIASSIEVAPPGRPPLLSSCAVLRAPAPSIDAFLEAWHAAFAARLGLVSELSVATLEDLATEAAVPPAPGVVLAVFGLQLAEARGAQSSSVSVIDPSRGLWSRARVLEGLAASLGRVQVVLIDEEFHSFGARWYERGALARTVLTIDGVLEQEGPTMIEEVGLDMGRLDAQRTRLLAGLGADAEQAPMRVLVYRDYEAEQFTEGPDSR
ncbi:MAG: hypothetical protein U0271_47780 [Polyangiaceae bacterium]